MPLKLIVNCCMHSRYISWSRQAFLAGMVLALVLVIPTAWFPFQLFKLAAFALCLAASVILFVVGGGVRDLLRTHGFKAALMVALLPLAYLLSYLFSADKSIGFSGFGIETDTIVFTMLMAVAYLMAFNLFRTLRTANTLLSVVLYALIAAAAFQCVSVLFGSSVIPFQAFADRSVNLVGKWNDLGLLSALLIIFLFVRVELASATNAWRLGAWVGAAALTVLLALINFSMAWGLLLVGCMVIGLLAMLRRRSGEDADAPRVPWYAAAGIVVSVLFLLYGGSVNSALTKVVPVSSLEVRPSAQSTLEVASAAREGSLARALVGSGPNTFGQQWLLHKPSEVNQSPFWNLDFNVGFSTLATAFLSVGLLGVLAWLVPFVLLAAALVRAVRLGALSRDERVAAASLGISGLILMGSLLVYVPSQNVLLLGVVLAGAGFGFLWRQGRPAADEALPAATMRAGLAVLALAAVLIVASIATTAVIGKRFVSQAYVGKGLSELGAGNASPAIALAQRAVSWDSTPDANRLRVDAGLRRLNVIATDSMLSAEEARTQFTNEVQAIVPAGQAGILAAPGDYRGYYSIGRVYDYLASLKVQGAYDNAKLAYTAALQRNPTNPAIPLALARLEASQGNAQAMQEALQKSLTLKPDYTDAILFTVQLNVANNDLASAIKNTQAAVNSAPGVASIWFQLGLLYYAAGDTKSSIPVLEQAINLAPEYANAKYFLGLSYYAQDRKNDAEKLFVDLAASNPDNAEVKTILQNIRQGTPPLQGETSPTERDQAPITE